MVRKRKTAFSAITSERNGNSSEEVIRQIRDMIHDGTLKLGDRLPAERDLARTLGVSRPTLRAGIRSLVALGVLQSRQGAGTFVVENSGSPTLDGDALQMLAALHGFTSDEMFEARLALEMSICGLAAERASSEQMTQLAEEIAGMYASIDDPEQYLVHDMHFHQTIAAASGNRILTALMNMIATILFEHRSKTVKNAIDLKDSAEQHRVIYRALREGDSDSARGAMRDHLVATQAAQKREVADAPASEN